jgi:hypothetical protein
MLIPTHPLKLLRGVPNTAEVANAELAVGRFAITVSAAALEGIEPAVLLTTHMYWVPLCASVVAEAV